MSKPKFEIHAATISYHPSTDVAAALDEKTDVLIGGVLRLRGWTRSNALITSCDLVLDESVPKGEIRIEPGSSSHSFTRQEGEKR